jgi:hypothetical protein
MAVDELVLLVVLVAALSAWPHPTAPAKAAAATDIT